MLAVHPQYITDNKGKKVSVVLPLKEFKTMIEGLEELEDIKIFDEVKKSKESSVPMDEAFKIIEAKRKSKK